MIRNWRTWRHPFWRRMPAYVPDTWFGALCWSPDAIHATMPQMRRRYGNWL
jgi:hypothetical protein